ncbi:MAG TPA: penicillin-binding protein 2 [Candidatus Paceibacterota bacterium]
MSLNAKFVTRVRITTALLVLVAFIIVGRLWVLQVMHGAEYARRADAQTVRLESPLLSRGAIYFTTKDGTPVLAATLRPPQDVATHSTSSGQALKQRYYPGRSLAAQTIGFVAYNNDDEQKGRYGLERYYDATLTRSGENLYTNFFVQLFGTVQSVWDDSRESQGDVVTTIEPSVQSELERTLRDYDTQWHPTLAGGIVMDPHTGEIVAMAISPTFDLNSFNTVTDPVEYANPMAQNVFEMGSIIKPLTVAAGLDSGAITETETYNDTGCITVDTKKICNYDFKARGVIPMQQILSQSLNVGASYVATKMGPDIMRDYFRNHYRLDQETGIDLPGEVHGLTGNLDGNRAVEFDTASFGQGIALTPIETVRALATLGNGGYLVTPHLVKAIKEIDGKTRTLGWGDPVQVLKPETSTTISRMLTTVVDTTLAKGDLKMEHYSIAAKTGTAQIADPVNGGYYADKYLHSFFGYFPSFNPRFVVFLFAKEPQGAPFASQTWAPPFKSLTQFLINYYNIAPDR